MEPNIQIIVRPSVRPYARTPREATTFSDWLKRLIIESGLTHKQIARMAGVSRWTITKFMSGYKPDMRICTIDKLFTAFGLDMRDLIDFDIDPEPENDGFCEVDW